MSKILEVKTIEPFAMSPEGAAAALSISKRAVYLLIADGALIAKRSGARTLVDYQSVKDHYASLPRKTVSASIPNAPQCIGVAPARRRRSMMGGISHR